ncbi:MAG: hypothetical protein AAGG08_03965 [Actinomycetota bacterium]
MLVLAVACSGNETSRWSDESAPDDAEPAGTPLDFELTDPDLVQSADRIVGTLGDAGGFAAVLRALDLGYSVDQIIEAGTAADLQADGSMPGRSPALPASGLFPDGVQSSSDVEVNTASMRIVSVSPMGTDLVYALGAGPQVVAADMASLYPPHAPRTTLTVDGRPSDELILAFDPDLVILPRSNSNVMRTLENAGVEVLIARTGFRSLPRTCPVSRHAVRVAHRRAPVR